MELFRPLCPDRGLRRCQPPRPTRQLTPNTKMSLLLPQRAGTLGSRADRVRHLSFHGARARGLDRHAARDLCSCGNETSRSSPRDAVYTEAGHGTCFPCASPSRRRPRPQLPGRTADVSHKAAVASARHGLGHQAQHRDLPSARRADDRHEEGQRVQGFHWRVSPVATSLEGGIDVRNPVRAGVGVITCSAACNFAPSGWLAGPSPRWVEMHRLWLLGAELVFAVVPGSHDREEVG